MELEKFLKSKRLYTRAREASKEYSDNIDNCDTISGIFRWSDTNEGHEFWKKLNSEYERTRNLA